MRIWKFYKNLSDEEYIASDDLDIEDKYPLYAFTHKKKHRDLFRKMRDKNKFIELETEITKEEFVEFLNARNRQLLRVYKYQHFPRGKDYQKSKGIKILSTGDERETTGACMEDVFDADSMNGVISGYFNPFLFGEEYIRALNILQYIELWKMYTHENTCHSAKFMHEMGYELDYSYPSLLYDEFLGFISLYGNTFNYDFKE